MKVNPEKYPTFCHIKVRKASITKCYYFWNSQKKKTIKKGD